VSCAAASPVHTTAPRLGSAVLAFVVAGLALGGCGESVVTGEGQFGRTIEIASDPARPLPRMVWRPGEACPGPVGGCESFCTGPPDSCPANACMPLMIDSGTPLSIIPSSDGTYSYGEDCLELRSGGGLLEAPDDPEVLAETTASFRLIDAPMIHAPGGEIDGWNWQAGDELDPVGIGGVIGGNILRDFALELRHLEGEPATVAFFSQFPGTETVLGDQGLAYVRLQYPGRLLGRLLNDRCEIGPGLDCELDGIDLNQNSQELLFESTRALVDACVAPPPCAVRWIDGSCQLSTGGAAPSSCSHAQGESATLVVATGVPGLVLFDDSAAQLLGALEQLPSCAELTPESETPACTVSQDGRLVLPGWAPLESLLRVRVRSLALVQGLDQPTGASPCTRLRNRFEGLHRQCEGFAAEGRPIHPGPKAGTSIGTSLVALGEVVLEDDQLGPESDRWLDTLILPATAPPVIALRREVVPEGAQPDGMIGGALLAGTETVLDFTEASESPGLRVRCLDPGTSCVSVPACEADEGEVDIAEASPGRTSCCFGLPAKLIAEVVLEGENKQAPRVEDACCPALPRAAITDLQSPSLDLCTGVDLP
jgi:hypothetical protein